MVDARKALERLLAAKRPIEVDPDEPDESFCQRKFGGRTFKCTGCGTEIGWMGACDECVTRFDETTMTDFDRIRRCGVPHGFADCTWARFDSPKGLKTVDMVKQIEELKTWRGIPPLAILSGRPGTGKTHMAVATMWRRLRSKGMYGMKFYQERTLLERLKQDFDSGGDALARAMRCKFLVIDDFGQSRMTEWVIDTMFGLVCRRFDEGAVTLLTTNLTHTDINAIDPRLGSRVYQALAVNTNMMPDRRKGKPDAKTRKP